MTTLTEFLLARIDEDETAVNNGYEWAWEYGVHLAWETNDPEGDWLRSISEVPKTHPAHRTRVFTECEAKRRIVEQVSDVLWGSYAVRDTVLRLLALPYSDHPDYQQEWTP